MNRKKQGTVMKSYFLSQIIIDKAKVIQLIEDNSLNPQNMTIEEWQLIAKSLNFELIPHAWYLLKEGYLRYLLSTYLYLNLF